MNRFSALMLLAGGLISTVEVDCFSQTLPTFDDGQFIASKRKDTRRIVRTDLARRAERAREALRRGDMRAMSQELIGPDFVVDFENLAKELARPNSAGPEFVVDFEKLPYYNSQRMLAQGMLEFAKGNYKDASRKAEEVMVVESSAPGPYYSKPGLLLPEAYQLLATSSLKMGVLTVANKYASYAQAATNDHSHAGASNLIKVIRDTAGDYKCEGYQELVLRGKTGHVHGTACKGSLSGIQPVAVVVKVKDYSGARAEGLFSGSLTVDADGESQPRQYRLVYRDRLLPPLILLHCGTTIPDSSELLKFIGDFSGDEWTRRAQMEALYFQQAGLAPLAAHWARRGGVDDPLLKVQVKQPLEQKGNWDWKIFSVRTIRSGGVPYEMVEYRNTDSDSAERFRLSIPLEHVYFAVGSAEDQRYLASYRLVSESVAAGERVYFVQRIVGQRISILEARSEAPDYLELNNQVATWIHGTKETQLTHP